MAGEQLSRMVVAVQTMIAEGQSYSSSGRLILPSPTWTTFSGPRDPGRQSVHGGELGMEAGGGPPASMPF